jgi:saccharopine dehydrogenase-like NADP-dependent oxidoreductase
MQSSDLRPTHLDVNNIADLENLISRHDHVISFIPPWMHTPIAEACLKLGKNMITSSYISPAMEEMHEKVRAKGLIFLNECGLDPGIDIMGTMKIVHEAEKAGFKVTSYESYCGGLPVAD